MARLIYVQKDANSVELSTEKRKIKFDNSKSKFSAQISLEDFHKASCSFVDSYKEEIRSFLSLNIQLSIHS
jgi:hypothetical protein